MEIDGSKSSELGELSPPARREPAQRARTLQLLRHRLQHGLNRIRQLGVRPKRPSPAGRCFRDILSRISGKNHSRLERTLSGLDDGVGPSSPHAALTSPCDAHHPRISGESESILSDLDSSDESDSRFERILSGLDAGSGPCSQLSALAEFRDVLLLSSTVDLLAGFSFDSLVPSLLAIANEDGDQNVMLQAIRAIAYLCDRSPQTADYLVRYDAVPVLCARLTVIENLDVAEQCLQALRNISRDLPVVCLNAGVILAVLSCIDSFSTCAQRVAVSTVANICRELPSDCSAHVMVAIPILCNLLQYEDHSLVETVALTLKRIVASSSCSSEMLDELCKHGVIHHSNHLLALHSLMTVWQPTYMELFQMLARLASVSLVAIRTLFEQNMSSTLKDILTSADLSHRRPHSHLGDMHSNLIHEVLKLLNMLLPPLPGVGEHIQELASDKEKILMDQPELLCQFGVDILPVLIQMVNSGANLTVCYGCLYVINKLVYFSSAEVLLELLNNANLSSFLAIVLAQYDDHHVLISALRIADIVTQKLPETFPNSFVKEGVLYAVGALLMSEKSSKSVFQKSRNIHQSSVQTANRCLCYGFDIGRPSLLSETGPCKLEKDTVQTLAKHLKSQIGLTETIQKLKTFSALLSNDVNVSSQNDCCAGDEYFSHILEQMMMGLNGANSISTFEFIESEVVRCLAHYLSNGKYLKEKADSLLPNDLLVLLKRFETFVKISLTAVHPQCEDTFLTLLVRKLQNALSTLEHFPVIGSHASMSRDVYANIPGRRTTHPCFRVHFVREEGESVLSDHSLDVLTVDAFSSFDDIERFLWPKVGTNRVEDSVEPKGKDVTDDLNTITKSSQGNPVLGSNYKAMQSFQDSDMQDTMKQGVHYIAERNADMKTRNLVNVHKLYSSECTPSKFIFYLKGKELDCSLTLYQAILQQVNEDNDVTVGPKFWSDVYEVKYRRAIEQNRSDTQKSDDSKISSACRRELGLLWQKLSFVSSMMAAELPCNLDRSNPTYDILFLLKFLEGLNRFTFQIMSHERLNAFAEGRIDNFDDLKVRIPAVPQVEFVNGRLSDKLTQQMKDPLAVSVAGMPSWCSQLMDACPFLFSFEARRTYFRLTVFGSSESQPHPLQQWTGDYTNGTNYRQSYSDRLYRDKFHVRRSHILDSAAQMMNLHARNQEAVLEVDSQPHPLQQLTGDYSNGTNSRQSFSDGLHRDKFHVHRNHILDSAVQMMNLHARNQAVLEVEFHEEVGTGLGPTMEFYTLVSHEFQMAGLGMWRDGHSSQVEDSKHVKAPLGLFPRPWSAASCSSNGELVTEVIDKFLLLGQVVAKAIKDRRVMDVPFSKAFYKLILEQDLDIYDINSFDPELGRTLLEFQALVERKRTMESVSGKNTTSKSDLHFRGTRIEDLCLDFSLPGYNDYKFGSTPDQKMVNSLNLEEYVSLLVDATVKSGISRQVEGFRTGFNQVFPLKTLQIFTEDEIERLLCGEQETWVSGELLDLIKFDHGYTASSPSINNFLEIIQEFGCDERRAFLQFLTGAPRLPPGGLAALNPKLTIVRKHWSKLADLDLPSVTTCKNYLKLPPYSSKEIMREKLLYAITEGQRSFHLS
ncbi:hypothetical protein MRB53_029430 [Persea americana]|uniref:Uncharacterized protein n=1 Tax=Persea americana TaxID=3435 RepID=A0ACC2KIQ8_PERAE|nr:hypothetical protein MRB53_029430 [Persea americana]